LSGLDSALGADEAVFQPIGPATIWAIRARQTLGKYIPGYPIAVLALLIG
jgi:hypothetical protein